MIYTVLRIDEDIDFGGEERDENEPVMAVVSLLDENGKQLIIRQEDQRLYDLNINEGDLYIATHDGNQVHRQMRENGNVQILAKKEGSREWLRITGKAKECSSIEMKQRMLNECPILSKHYPSAESEHYLLFQIKVLETEFK